MGSQIEKHNRGRLRDIVKNSLLALCPLLVIVSLATVYLWYTLPKIDAVLSLAVVIIAIILIFILGNCLKTAAETETSLNDT